MTDLDRQLSEYIDAIADPVTLDEVTAPALTKPLWRARPVFAAMAGAAVVLIPVLAIVVAARLTGPSTTVPPVAPSSTTEMPGTTVIVDPSAPPATTTMAPAPSTTLRRNLLESAVIGQLSAPGDSVRDGSFFVSTGAGIFFRGEDGTRRTFYSGIPITIPMASGHDGALYLAQNGRVYQLGPDTHTRLELPVHPDASPSLSTSLALVTVGDTVVLMHFGHHDEDFYGYDVIAGEPWREGVSAAIADGILRVAGERFALLTDDTGNELSLDEMGTTDVYLTVGELDESDVTSVKVSTPFDEVVRIHDFDGRRVLLSRRPVEFALHVGPTYILIDMECVGVFGCVEILVESVGTAALYRAVPSTGPLASELPAVGECSTAGSDPGILGHGDIALPAAAQETAEQLIQLAGACDIASLHYLEQEMREPRAGASILQLSHGWVDGIAGAEMSGLRPLAELLEVLQFEPGRRDELAEPTLVWPAIAAEPLDWENLTDAEIDTLAEIYDRALLEESRALGAYAGAWVEIQDNGLWVFLGRNLS